MAGSRMWRQMPAPPHYLHVRRSSATDACVRCYQTNRRLQQTGHDAVLTGPMDVDVIEIALVMQPELVQANRELTRTVKNLQSKIQRRDEKVQALMKKRRQVKRAHIRELHSQHVKHFKDKGVIRLSVVDTLVDLHVHCGTPMRRCVQALILAGQPADIEWADKITSHMTVARGLIQRGLVHKLALAGQIAGIECLGVGQDGTTTSDLRSVLGLRIDWLANIIDEEEDRSEDDGRRSAFAGLVEMRRGKTAKALLAALVLFTTEMRSFQELLGVPTHLQTYMYNWRECGLDNEITNHTFVTELNLTRKEEVAAHAGKVSLTVSVTVRGCINNGV
jgi:hypothetical protein